MESGIALRIDGLDGETERASVGVNVRNPGLTAALPAGGGGPDVQMVTTMASQDLMLRILLVEDNPADARLLREALLDAALRFDLQIEGRLQSALIRLAERPFDVALLDLSLKSTSSRARATAGCWSAPSATRSSASGARRR